METNLFEINNKTVDLKIDSAKVLEYWLLFILY